MSLEGATVDHLSATARKSSNADASLLTSVNGSAEYLLVVDPDDESRAHVERILSESYQVVAVSDAASALKAVEHGWPELALLDHAVIEGPDSDWLATL